MSVMAKTFAELTEIASQFDPHSDDVVIAEMRGILDEILGFNENDMMSEAGQIDFLRACEDGIFGENEDVTAAAKKLQPILFG
jgi:hypothetical protein